MGIESQITEKIRPIFINSVLANGDFSHLLITFTKIVRPDLNPNFLAFTTCIVFLKEFFKSNFEKKISRWQQKHENYPACKVLSSIKVLLYYNLKNIYSK